MKITFCFRFIVFLIICLGFNSYTFCQESYIKGRWNIKAGYSQYSLGSWSKNEEYMTGHYRLETNYGFFDAVETGIYFGYSEISIGLGETDPTLFYGLNLNLHPLPLFIDLKNPLFEVYLAGKFGSRYHTKNHKEYSIGVGSSVYLFPNIGIYMEYLYGNHGSFVFLEDHMKLRYGLSLRF